MIKDKIWIGKEIETVGGYEVVTGYNGHLVFTDSYELDENGNGVCVDDRTLTLSEIGHLMKEMDGYNHKVEYVRLSDMSFGESDFENVLKAEYKAFVDGYKDDIQKFVEELTWNGFQFWMEEYLESQGYEDPDEADDTQREIITQFVKEILQEEEE